jgi:hypothetical protein
LQPGPCFKVIAHTRGIGGARGRAVILRSVPALSSLKMSHIDKGNQYRHFETVLSTVAMEKGCDGQCWFHYLRRSNDYFSNYFCKKNNDYFSHDFFKMQVIIPFPFTSKLI